MIHKFNLTPFRDILKSNLYEYEKHCVTCFANFTANPFYLENVETNIKILKDFIYYIKQDRGTHTFKHFIDINHLYNLVRFILKNDETAQTNESFLRLVSSVCVSMIIETKYLDYGVKDEYSVKGEGNKVYEEAKALKEKISSYLEELE